MTSKTLGHRTARLQLVDSCLDSLMDHFLLGLLVYVAMPLATLLLPDQFDEVSPTDILVHFQKGASIQFGLTNNNLIIWTRMTLT